MRYEEAQHFSESLSNPKDLAKEIYEYWVSLLRADRVDGSDSDDMDWDVLKDEIKNDFILSIKYYVTDRFSELERIRKMNEPATASLQSPKQRGCYLCEQQFMSYSSTDIVCDVCKGR